MKLLSSIKACLFLSIIGAYPSSVLSAQTVENGFTQVPGALEQISAGSDGAVWGINSFGNIYSYDPELQTWHQAPGSLAQIAVGASTFVWGLNGAGQIYRWDPYGQQWQSIPGSLAQITVGADGDVWGINSASLIFHFDSDTQSWDWTPGSLSRIAVGFDGAVWGINAQQSIYRFNPGTRTFVQVPGSLTQISIGADGDVWGLNALQQIWHFNSRLQSWDAIPGNLVSISVGSATNVFGLNSAGSIYTFNSQTQKWVQISGTLSRLSASANGSVWALDSSGAIYNFVNSATTSQSFQQTPGSLASITVGPDANVWGLNSANQIYHFNPLSQQWENVPGSLVQIAVGFAGNVWGINASESIYRFDTSAQRWKQIPGWLGQIAVGLNGDVWGINPWNSIYRFDPATNTWQNIPGSLRELSIGADGAVWGVNAEGQVYQYNAQAQSWSQMPGQLSKVAVGSSNHVWGLDSAGQALRFDPTNQNWDSTSVTLSQISVGFDGTAWGINSAGQIYRFDSQVASWQQVGGALSQIASPDDGLVWGLNPASSIYEFLLPPSTLVESATAPLQVVGTSPVNAQVGVSVQQSISIEFNEAIDPGTIGPNGFSLIDSNGNQIPVQYSYDAGVPQVTLTPTALLIPSSSYTVTVGASVHSLTGIAIPANFSMEFTTAAPMQVSGTVVPPPGVDPSTLTVVGFREQESAPDSTGTFTTGIDEVGPTLLTTPLPTTSAALMAVALRDTTSALNQPTSTGRMARLKPLAKHVHPHQITASTSGGDGIGMDFQTTAETVLFDSAALFNRDPEIASSLLGVIAADPNTAALASAIQNASSQPHPFQAPAVTSAYTTALRSVLSTLTQNNQSMSTSTQSRTRPAISPTPKDVATNPRPADQSGSSTTADYTSIDATSDLNVKPFVLNGSTYTAPVGVPGPHPNPFNFSPGSAVGWMMRVTQLPSGWDTSTLRADAVNGNPQNPDSPVTQPGEGTAYPIQSGLWIPSNSIWKYKDIVDDEVQLSNALWNTITGQTNTEDAGSQIAIPATTGNSYLVRYYSGGFSDPDELALVSGDSAIPNGKTLWRTALAANLLIPVFELLPIPDPDVSCLIDGNTLVQVAADANLAGPPTLSDFPRIAMDLYNGIRNNVTNCGLDAGVQGTLTSKLEELGTDAAADAEEDIAQLVKSAGSFGQEAQAILQLAGEDSPVDTAYVTVGTPTGTQVARVVINPDTVSVATNQSATATATAYDAYQNVISGATFQWTSANSSVASIGETSANSITISGGAGGTTTITATAPGGISGSATVNVSSSGPAAHFTMTAQSQTAPDGGTLNLAVPVNGSVTVNFSSTSMPGGAPIATYIWQSNGSTICQNSSTCSLAFGTPSNSITLIVKDADGNSSTATGQVNVKIGGLQITAVSPSNVSTGSNNQTITVTGAGFQSGLTVPISYPGGSGVLSGSQIQSVTSTSFQVLVTFNNPGTYTISVTNPNGSTSNTAQITATSRGPTISQVSPSSVSTGSGNQTITVTGSNFQSGLTVPISYPGGSGVLSGSQIQSVTSTSFQVLITFNNPGTYTISAKNPDGSTSNTAQITATSPGPTISQVSPSSVSTGSGNQTITVTGSNFQSGLTVPISYPGGSGVLSGSQIQNVTSTSFQVLITFNNPGTYTISVKNPDGSTSNTAQITAM